MYLLNTGVAAEQLSLDRSGSHGAGSQSGELLRRGGADRLRTLSLGAWHRAQSGQDAPRSGNNT